jgi:HTH-type transcriptional regulator, competence development regulator
MAEDADSSKPSGVTLGQYLESIRTARGLTLRAVEEATDKQVSNAYLSQIENNKIKQPSPNILHTLAELYSVKYERLMELAGYIVSTSSPVRTQAVRHGRAPTFAEYNLTSEEESQLLDFLQMIRKRKKRRDETG